MDNNDLTALPESVKEQYSTEDIERSFKVLLANPDLIERLIKEKEKSKTRRKNWSRLSRSSYYNKRFALELKAVIDEMLERGVDKEYRFEDYKELKPATIYLRINHAKLYLLDELDPDGKYKEALSRIHIGMEPKGNPTGVRLTLMKYLDIPMKPVDISLDEKKSDWKEKIDKYLLIGRPGDKPLHLKGLSLTADEVETLKESFLELNHVGAIILPTEIKIMIFNK